LQKKHKQTKSSAKEHDANRAQTANDDLERQQYLNDVDNGNPLDLNFYLDDRK